METFMFCQNLLRRRNDRITALMGCALAFVHAFLGARVGAQSSDRFHAAEKTIDRLLERTWEGSSIQPAPQSTDAEFCRRIWLDLAGVAPPVWQLRTFLADKSASKRERLIDDLLASPRFATHMANRWNETLLPSDAFEDQRGNADALHQWLVSQFQRNVPYDHFVGSFLTAGGKSDRGPAIFYTSRNLEPVKLAAATSRIFMGVQIQCAQCHDDPYDRWKQDDFWSFAAFFAQLQQGNASMSSGQIIEDRPGLEVTFPESDRVMPPLYPGSDSPPEKDPSDFRRRQLTIWLASRDNPYFARAAVNRAWAHLFGKGLVDPVDEMDTDESPRHPELLQFLADYFVHQRFDLRDLYATLARTNAYGRTSRSESGRPNDAEAFASMMVKTLTAHQYFDTLNQNVLRNATAGDQVRQQFLSRMRVSDANTHDYPHGVVQALGMMNGPEMINATAQYQSGLLATLMAPFLSDQDRVSTLFLACLSRPPTASEKERFETYLSTAKKSDAKMELRPNAVAERTDAETLSRMSDIAWVLLNTAECYMCR